MVLAGIFVGSGVGILYAVWAVFDHLWEDRRNRTDRGTFRRGQDKYVA